MSNQNQPAPGPLSALYNDPFFLGFSRVFDVIEEGLTLTQKASRPPNYPPFNLLYHSNGMYVIEMAVAGFSAEDLSIQKSEGSILVEGKIGQIDQNPWKALQNGIAKRDFSRRFNIHNLSVSHVVLKDGLLSIVLFEPKDQPTSIPINGPPSIMTEADANIKAKEPEAKES